MDTTETYIKMCEKAEEIQKDWYADCGDYIRLTKPDKRVVLIIEHPAKSIVKPNWLMRVVFPKCSGDNTDYKYIKGGIWLPRQDQLQEMVLDYWWGNEQPQNNISVMLQKFWWWLNDACPNFQSMEQLWLAYVMKEKHNKTWNGKEWVKYSYDI